MKERDLMIGDLVTAVYKVEKENGEYELKRVPAIITGIDENGTLVDGSCRFSFVPLEKHDYGVYCYEIKPIPITKEILEKNGFDIHETLGEWCPSIKDNGFSFNNRYADEPLEIDVCGLYVEIRYVHELQHALRLCGLNNFANNFKI